MGSGTNSGRTSAAAISSASTSTSAERTREERLQAVRNMLTPGTDEYAAQIKKTTMASRITEASSLVGMTDEQILSILNDANPGTKIRGIYDSNGRYSLDSSVEKHEGYTNLYGRYNSLSAGERYKETWWTVAGSRKSEHDILRIIKGNDEYYTTKKPRQKK